MARTWRICAVAACLSAATFASGDTRPFTIDDAMSVRRVADPRFSPDGQRIVYCVGEYNTKANADRSSLWVVPAAGGAPLRLTYLGTRDRSPAWSADGQQIAFLSDRDSVDDQDKKVEGRTQVWVLSAGGGEARQVTKSPTPVSEFAWSPDGARLVFAAPTQPTDHEQREKRRREGFDAIVAGDYRLSELRIVDLATGVSTRLTDGRFDATEATWSPRGDLIAFVARPTPGANEQLLSDLYVVPAAGGEARRVVDNEGPDFAPAWSPDGSRIAYLSNTRRQSSGAQNTIMVVPVRTGTPQQVVAGFEALGWETRLGRRWSNDLLHGRNPDGVPRLRRGRLRRPGDGRHHRPGRVRRVRCLARWPTLGRRPAGREDTGGVVDDGHRRHRANDAYARQRAALGGPARLVGGHSVEGSGRLDDRGDSRHASRVRARPAVPPHRRSARRAPRGPDRGVQPHVAGTSPPTASRCSRPTSGDRAATARSLSTPTVRTGAGRTTSISWRASTR